MPACALAKEVTGGDSPAVETALPLGGGMPCHDILALCSKSDFLLLLSSASLIGECLTQTFVIFYSSSTGTRSKELARRRELREPLLTQLTMRFVIAYFSVLLFLASHSVIFCCRSFIRGVVSIVLTA
jgi:hypothetical protein